MADVAALNLKVDSSSVKQATVELKSLNQSATAAEKAAQRWGMSATDAARSADDFSRRVQGTIKSLEFERQQLTRTAAEQAKYAALRRAGVSAMSAEGQAIAASVAALQAQKAAAKGAGEAHGALGVATKTVTAAGAGLVEHLKALALAYISVEGARALWETAMKAGDLGEQAEQIGINTDQLQAYRLAGAQAGIETEQLDGAITKLARAMGSANDGNKEMIERFQQLGVKLLDARGELRPTADVLPEVAKGVLGVGSSSQRTAILMDLFGKSGAKMATVLKDVAGGNDALIESARQQNAIISPQAIEAWDTVGDRMKVTQQRFATLVAEFGADFVLPGIEHLNGLLEGTKKELEGIQSLWKWIMSNMDAAKTASIMSSAAPSAADRKNLQDRLDALRQNPTQFGFKASEKALMDQLAAADAVAQRAQAIASQAAMQQDEANARRGKLPAMVPPLGANDNQGSRGVGDPKVKGAGDAEAKAYQKIIDSAKDYIATKNAETAAIGMSVEAAARLKHETELVAKATNDNTVLTAAQAAQLKTLADAMAKADAAFEKAKFLDEAKKKSEEFVAQQQIERDTLFMSAEAAEAYKLQQGYLNDAKAKGIELSAADVAALQDLANAQAAAAETTRRTKELYDLAKDAFTGFITDIRQGLMDGKSVWETFANAATNALDKISSKLLEMAAQKLFESAFGGATGGGGGFLSGIFGSIFGGGGGVTSSAIGGPDGFAGLAGALPAVFANGAAFRAGDVVPFAGGGIVNSPTTFAMSRGRTGLMGEAGPEGIVPLHRGPGGGLGVKMYGGTQQQPPQIVELHLVDDLLDARIASGANVQIVRAAPSIVKTANKAVPSMVAQDHAQSGGDYRTMRK